MSQVGPALTSPTQFEMTLTDEDYEDEGEDTSSESSKLYGIFSSSPSAIQTGTTEQTFRPETPTPRSVHRLSNLPRDIPQSFHRRTGHSPPPSSTRFSTVSLPRWQYEHSNMQHHEASESLFHPFPPHYTNLTQGHRGSFENDPSFWDTDFTPISIQPRTGPHHSSPIPSRQLQHAMLPRSDPEWQYADIHTFPDDSQTRLIPTPPPSSSRYLTMPLSQQDDGIYSSWNHEAGITIPLDSYFPELLQSSGLPFDPACMFYHLVSDHTNSSHPENSLDVFPYAEDCMLLSLDKPGDDQSIR